jgi:hypothetical protein
VSNDQMLVAALKRHRIPNRFSGRSAAPYVSALRPPLRPVKSRPRALAYLGLPQLRQRERDA